MTKLSRRRILQLSGATTLMAGTCGFAYAKEAGQRKFVFVILRGAMDGLAALIPDDEEVTPLRSTLLPAFDERLNLGIGFRLHPSFAGLREMYRDEDAAFVHAASSGVSGRSHFDGQDALELLSAPGSKTGWLNRALQSMGGEGLAVGYSIPLALRGEAAVSNWSPPVFDAASDDLLNQLSELYADDPIFAEAMGSEQMLSSDLAMRSNGRGRRNYKSLFRAAGQLMSQPSGPNVGMVSIDGWDTHANQAAALNTRFRQLDEAIVAFKEAMGRAWENTCVIMCSEFGRTAAANGTRGTDHGTGGLLFLLGGAVKGGKLHGDWPGVREQDLFEGRDLAPANDIAGLLSAILHDHFGVDRTVLRNEVFPHARGAFSGLLK